MKLKSINPATYQEIGEVEISTKAEIAKAVAKANQVKISWKNLGVEKRTQKISPIIQELTIRKKDLAKLITQEVGKPISESTGDLDWYMEYIEDFIANGPKYLADEITHQDKEFIHKIVFEPIGTAAVIVPWNFPFGNFAWGVIPNLIAGNPVVFKHSEECPLTGKLLDEIMNKLNLPQGVFSQIYGNGKVGQTLVSQDINLIWFTGSTAVGKKIYQLAGKKFIKAIMEMGGSNPMVVFDDVDVEKIIDHIYFARFFNCGQVCDSLKRLILHEDVVSIITSKLKDRVEEIIIGDPFDKKTQMGSLVAKRQLDLLEAQVKDAVDKDAKLITGGKQPSGLEGAYYQPTILTNIKPNMRVWHEEVFGPVLPIVTFKTDEEAINLANNTIYGLGAQVFSNDQKRAQRVASQINAGCIELNYTNHWLSCNPFGGYKMSGMGREHGAHGFRELTQIKVISQPK